MIPLKLTLRGFLTYRDDETLDFENMRTAVIIGDNGHGKSALFDAVTYALFGKHRGSQTRYLVNQECRELAVRFEFEADGRRYRVDRALTLSPRKNGVPAPVATGLVWDGIDWQAVAHGVAECDAWVKDVLGGMTYEICCQSIVLRQGAHDMFLSAKPTQRQLVLNTLLDFEPYRRLQQAARERKGKARGAADDIEGRLGDLVAHDPDTFERLETGLAGALERSEQAELALSAYAAAEPETRAEATRLTNLKTALPWLRQVAASRKNIVDLAVTTAGLGETLSAEQVRSAADDDAIRAAKVAADSAAQHKRAADVRLIGAAQAIAGLEEQLAHRHEASDEQICTYCGQSIDAAYLSGSQRFRVAVALALGIGQYVGGAARGQRAVIIDEGFGSLDADGIDAMAEHLRDLSDRLDRVILVTHQPAMRKHFAEGFVVKRENGTSKVTPWPRSRTSTARGGAMLESAR